jgi:hypothetical protein
MLYLVDRGGGGAGKVVDPVHDGRVHLQQRPVALMPLTGLLSKCKTSEGSKHCWFKAQRCQQDLTICGVLASSTLCCNWSYLVLCWTHLKLIVIRDHLLDGPHNCRVWHMMWGRAEDKGLGMVVCSQLAVQSHEKHDLQRSHQHIPSGRSYWTTT